MKSKEPRDPVEPDRSGPLTDLVEDQLNSSLADEIAREIEKREEERPRDRATDYARGTAEHDDDSEA